MKISVVTPSYNQGRFIDETIRSVLAQDYPDMEYWVIDGGSTDNTVEILKGFGDRLHWVSEMDMGQADAVNKGIERSTGDVIAWINSDDIYYPGAFAEAARVFEEHPEVDVIYGDACYISENGTYMEDYYTEEWSYERLKEVCFLCQPAVFFRREAVIRAGLLNVARQYAMDYDLWLRMGKEKGFYYLRSRLAASRLYSENKTLRDRRRVIDDILDTLNDITGSVPFNWIKQAVQIYIAEPYDLEKPDDRQAYAARYISNYMDITHRYGLEPALKPKDLPVDESQITIGYDASMTCISKAGCGFYQDCLAEALSEVDTYNRYLFYPMYLSRYMPQFRECTARARTANSADMFYNNTPEQVCAAFNDPTADLTDMLGKPNVVHATGFAFVHNHKAANVYTIFDTSFLDLPDYTTEENRCFCYRMMHEASMYADMFIAISTYSKQRFLHYFPYVDPDTVKVIPLGTRDSLKPNRDIKPLKPFGITEPDSYWLCVNTIEPRKNVVGLLRAYKAFVSRGGTRPLYLVGGKGWKDDKIYKEAETLGLSDSVRFTGYVSDEQLSALYTNCFAFLYPSSYEGFGLPALEAMTLGAPVISSGTTSLPEVCGDAAILIDPADTEAIAQAMRELQNHPERRGDMIAKGLERGKQFSWRTNATETLSCYYEAIWRHLRKQRGK